MSCINCKKNSLVLDDEKYWIRQPQPRPKALQTRRPRLDPRNHDEGCHIPHVLCKINI